MVLLKLEMVEGKHLQGINLHSTMVLLKHISVSSTVKCQEAFTFHYGLIKTMKGAETLPRYG